MLLTARAPLAFPGILSDFWRRSYRKLGARSEVVSAFHKLYYESQAETWTNTAWLGVRVLKCPLDLWVYQEILHEVEPDVIVETGTYLGGSALFLASLCQLMNRGRVITVDIEERTTRPKNERITYLHGSSVEDSVLNAVRSLIRPSDQVLVILDSDHSRGHVLGELRGYAPLVTNGSYLIVEDTNINGHPVEPSRGPGPMEAVTEFLRGNRDFVVDRSREKFLLSFNPGGFLRCTRETQDPR